MRLEVQRDDDLCTLQLAGRLTLGDGDVELSREFRAQLGWGQRRFVLDLRQLGQLDSAGVGELVACAKRAGDVGGVVKVALGAEGQVRRVFALSGLDRVFELYDDRDRAAASFAR
ncbi:MAG TPA: STAS domain-containing protein [Candidatus Polarisedimenticolaceae bacterium]|nr:STAS domain-containing protein [Candidatus Polarisedimenticolaceae bacterium]